MYLIGQINIDHLDELNFNNFFKYYQVFFYLDLLFDVDLC